MKSTRKVASQYALNCMPDTTWICFSRAVRSCTNYPQIVVISIAKVVAVRKIRVPLSVPAFRSKTSWLGGNGVLLILNLKSVLFVAAFKIDSYMYWG